MTRHAVAAALALFSVFTAVAPHGHAFAPSEPETRTTACSEPSTALTHLDASRVAHQHACIACARQHLNGLTSSRRSAPVPRRPSALLALAPIVVATSGQRRIVLLRGPPPLSSLG